MYVICDALGFDREDRDRFRPGRTPSRCSSRAWPNAEQRIWCASRFSKPALLRRGLRTRAEPQDDICSDLVAARLEVEAEVSARSRPRNSSR